MFKTLFSTLAAAGLALSAAPAFSQDVNAMNNAFNAQLNAQMQSATQNMVQTNMNDPHVQQMYYVYLQQGGTLNFPSYCFRYAETGGMTPEGTGRAMRSSNQIHAQDMQNFNRYADGSRRMQQATYDYRNQVQDSWAAQRGDNLTARSTYVNDRQGTSWQLPNASPERFVQDQTTGTMFYMDAQGQYWMNDGQGWQGMRYRK